MEELALHVIVIVTLASVLSMAIGRRCKLAKRAPRYLQIFSIAFGLLFVTTTVISSAYQLSEIELASALGLINCEHNRGVCRAADHYVAFGSWLVPVLSSIVSYLVLVLTLKARPNAISSAAT